MKKKCAVLFIISFSSSLLFASNLASLSQLISTPGFTIENDGKFLTSMKADKGNRLPASAGKEYYGSPQINVYAEFKGPDHLQVPAIIAINNHEKRQRIYAELDENGDINGTKKCENSVCATITKDYCKRIYKDLSVDSGQKLVEKIAACSDMAKMDPTKQEIDELSKVWIHAQNDRPGSPALFPDGNPDAGDESGYAKVMNKTNAFHNRVFKIHSVKISASKMLMIAELCKAALPDLLGHSSAASKNEKVEAKK